MKKPDCILEVCDLHRAFGALRVLDGLSLSVQRGEVYGFLGRNGTGKSTVIRILMGITHADRGRVCLFGEPVQRHLIAHRQRIGYVAQEQHFYPWMTPVSLAGFVSGYYPKWRHDRFRELVHGFELPFDRRIGTFSGGMKAKLALSLALSSEPELLLLDEPTAGMDPVARREFLSLVETQATGRGTTIFFSTHLLDDIEAIADRICIVEGGLAVYEGELEPLLSRTGAYSIPLDLASRCALPEPFLVGGVRQLQRVERRDRLRIILQFDQRAPALVGLDTPWRQDPLSLEDVFVALVSANARPD